jgi:ABC-2 type transport system ATP-binding protein
MTPDPVIDVRDISVRYFVPHERIPTLKEFAVRWFGGRVEWRHFQALSHVSFSVFRGDSIGIVGRNGAGKTTLLKVVARVLRPQEGTVETHGRVVPLLELGAGFDPELSGRENIYLYGAMLGHPRKYMDARFDHIVDFADLREFIDAPLRTYSTGMVARLGFAIATDVEPDILLVDEVLSVGDLGFQRKCEERMAAFRREGVTFVVVSHSLETLKKLCTRILWVEHGRVVRDGPAAEVAAAFEVASGVDAPLASPAA